MSLPEPRTLASPPGSAGPETIETLACLAGSTVEHIVSRAAASPAGFWYDQNHPEWVLLLSGRATLRFDGGSRDLSAGQHLLIPAGLRHRVEHCSVDATWLAVHFPG